MGYADPALTIVGLTALFHFTNAYVEVPFIHDFDTGGLHGWIIGRDHWQWLANSVYPDTRHIPSFYSSGSYLWTQKTLDDHLSPSNMLKYEFITGVTRDTKLHVSYWFYTREVRCGFLAVNATEGTDQSFTVKMTDKNSTDWDELVIDCQHDSCCQRYPCHLGLSIMGSAGCSDGNGFIAIRSVSGTKTTLMVAVWEMVIEHQHFILTMVFLIIILGAVIINVRNRKRNHVVADDTEKLCPRTKPLR